MYTVTFYSFKGGVGRTMALANVAYILAKSGKRVLVVDFDLEAPGLPSYEAFQSSEDKKGLVEYITEYTTTKEAPFVDDYITSCEFQDVKMWVMPAGRYKTPSYSEKLNEINWRKLYEEEEGFLFLEDMKQQWNNFDDGKGFDYVLIDSRTGYTDVGGICTRQLPDSVVLMFIPTPQNIEGLVSVVNAIRNEKYPVRDNAVTLLFCPSNVPDVDDEEEILANLLKKASFDLSYKKTASIVQNYQSIELLKQPIAAYSMPQSRLSKQYNTLKNSIIENNILDKDGAILILRSMMSDESQNLFETDFNILASEQLKTQQTEILTQIRAQWPNDADIAWEMAALANKKLQPEEEIEALSIAINNGKNPSNALIRRAMVYAALGRREQALSDINSLLLCDNPSVFSLDLARLFIDSYVPDKRNTIFKKVLDNPNITEIARDRILSFLMVTPESVSFVNEYSRKLINDRSYTIKNTFILSSIFMGKYKDAIECIDYSREYLLNKTDIDDICEIFNYAIAEWGLTKTVPCDLFKRVLDLGLNDGRSWGPNTLQCFSLALYIVGEFDYAKKILEECRKKVSSSDVIFSCWRYLLLNGSDFKKDIDDMEEIISQRKKMIPEVIKARFKKIANN